MTATRAPASVRDRTKDPAAFIGPIVCDEDGPMPILNNSKTLIMPPIQSAAAGRPRSFVSAKPYIGAAKVRAHSRPWRDQGFRAATSVRRGHDARPIDLTKRTFERCAVPIGAIRRGVVRALQKLQQRGVGRGGGTNGVIGQNEFLQILAEKCAVRQDRGRGETGRRGIGVGIKGWVVDSAAARPKTRAADLVRIGFTDNCVREMRNTSRVKRRAASGEACHGEVEAAPEKMNRAAFADGTGTEQFEHAIDLHERPPVSMCIFGIIGSMNPILAEADGLRQFIGDFIDRHADAEARETLDQRSEKSATATGRSGMRQFRPSLVSTSSRCSVKSNWISKALSPSGIGDDVSPHGVT